MLANYLESELKLLNHGSLKEYADSLFNNYMAHNAHMTPPPKEWKAITQAKGEERLQLEESLKETLAAKRIAPDEDQIIHYSEWDKAEAFAGASLSHLYHPHWRLAHDRILDQYRRSNDVLVVMFCAGTKPYSSNKMFQIYVDAARRGAFDYLISSLYPCPVHPFDASKIYPYVISDWHGQSSSRLEDLSIQVHVDYMIEFLKQTGYKRVVYHHIGLGDRQRTVDAVKERLPGDIELIDINRDEHLYDLLVEAFPGYKEHPHIMSIRWWSAKLGRELVAKYCSDPDFAREALKLPKRAPESSLEEFAG